MEAENGLTPPKAMREAGSYRKIASSRFPQNSIELRPIEFLPALPFGPGSEMESVQPTLPKSHPSTAVETPEPRSTSELDHERLASRNSEVIVRSSRASNQHRRRNSQWSQASNRLSKLLDFRGSIWLADPSDLILKFESREEEDAEFSDPPNHIFDRRRKKRLVYLVSLAAIFSPLSSNIYFPALNDIAESLHTPIALVALSVSIYMVFQGIAPSFWGPLADSYGRRPIFLSTLLVYLASNIGLAQSKSFAVLMFFRGVQAIGSSSTIAIGAGVIGDIALGSERGGFMGLFGGIRMFGQAIGPVFGGVLSQYLGFRSIFYFLFGFAAIVIILLTLYLPETLRKIAGDGSKPLYGIYKPPLGHSGTGPSIPKEDRYKHTPLTFTILFESFKLLAEKDVFVSLIFGGITYTVWSMITSSTPSLWKEEYNLNDVQIGLAFLPNGIGCVVGSLVTGKLMDRDYKREAAKYIEEHQLPKDTELKQHKYPDFPIERARLQSVYVLNALFVIATGIYGFSVEWSIIFPLILQFITAFTATAIFNINSTLMIDLYPSKPASATAINNLVRCTLGAIGVGFVEKSISAIDEGPTFLALAAITWASIILVIVARVYGPRWRMERSKRIKMKEDSLSDSNGKV